MSQTTEAAKAMVREKWKWLNKNILGEQRDHQGTKQLQKNVDFQLNIHFGYCGGGNSELLPRPPSVTS